MSKYEKKTRTAKLVNGKCDFCSNIAEIPWEGSLYCYNCFKILQDSLREINNETKTAKTRKETTAKSI